MTTKRQVQIQYSFSLDYSNRQVLTLNNTKEYQLDFKISDNYLVHRDILRQQLSHKQGTSSTKTRSEVRGGGKKPWRQKGTGRARAGSNRSPLWRGGGVIFGPKPKTTNLKLNKKERRLALQTMLYNKTKAGRIKIMHDLESFITEPKTKAFSDFSKTCSLNLNKKILLIVSKKAIPLKLSIQNFKNVELIYASNLNTLSLLKAKTIIVSPSAIKDIQEIYCE